MTPSYLQMIQKQPEGKLTLAPGKQNLKKKKKIYLFQMFVGEPMTLNSLCISI